eukprot:TRINITY_DN44816_c0_g1_i1.p1 TRINITY_DN44816_c0_g1~~TRINITY_DN44816_c0_g1_i1.p1  ORF type:complete len:393 (-),score=34.45 TRINITY_DN44816_c0_g1_i1:50-1228(-)
MSASVHVGFISLESGQFPFYPSWLREKRGKPGGELLAYYATQLGTIEMTSVNYRIPPPDVTRQWADSVPQGFVIHIKIFGLFSFGSCQRDALPSSVQSKLPSNIAQVRLKTLKQEIVEEVWRCFSAALEPLREQGKLGVIVSQFTQSFVPCEESYERLKQITEHCAPSSVAAEFRSPDWEASPEAMAMLEKLGIIVILTDDNGSFNNNNNFRRMPGRLRNRSIGYCRIHRRPRSSETGYICENVSRADIEASMRPDPITGGFAGDLSPGELSEWASLLSVASAGMKPGSQIYVHFSTIGRNSSADKVARLEIVLGGMAAKWDGGMPLVTTENVERPLANQDEEVDDCTGVGASATISAQTAVTDSVAAGVRVRRWQRRCAKLSSVEADENAS